MSSSVAEQEFHTARMRLADAAGALRAAHVALRPEMMLPARRRGFATDQPSVAAEIETLADMADALVAKIVGDTDSLNEGFFSWCSCGGLHP